MAKVSELMSENISNSVSNQETWGNILYNVKKYGAIGDGVADDTVEVQKAIDTAIENNAKLVYFPQGSYKVTALNNLDQVILMGDNAVFVGIATTILQFGTVRVDGKLDDFSDVDISTVLPQTGESLVFDGTKWKAGSGGDRVTTSTTNGNIKVNNVEKIVYTHPANHPASMIDQDATHLFVTDAEKTDWNSKADGVHDHSVGDITGLSTVATSGSYVDLTDTPTIPTVISDLTDVDTADGTTGQVLTQQPDGTWKPQTVNSGGGGATTLDGLTDVDTSTTPPTEGQSLVYQSGLWKPATVGGTANDITITDTNNHFTSTDVEGALDELFTNVSDGKVQLRDAVAGKGGTVTDADGDGIPTFQELSTGVNSIIKSTGDAQITDVRAGKIFSNAQGNDLTGALTVQSTVAQTVTPTTSSIVKQAGIYDGAITITGDPDLIPANIIATRNIFGVVGTAEYRPGGRISLNKLGGYVIEAPYNVNDTNLVYSHQSHYSPNTGYYYTWNTTTKTIKKINAQTGVVEQTITLIGHSNAFDFLFGVDSAGNMYVNTGSKQIEKYDSNGNKLWTWSGASSSGTVIQKPAVFVEADGTVYAGEQTNLGEAGSLHRIDPNGATVWSRPKTASIQQVADFGSYLMVRQGYNVYNFLKVYKLNGDTTLTAGSKVYDMAVMNSNLFVAYAEPSTGNCFQGYDLSLTKLWESTTSFDVDANGYMSGFDNGSALRYEFCVSNGANLYYYNANSGTLLLSETWSGASKPKPEYTNDGDVIWSIASYYKRSTLKRTFLF